MDDHFRASGTEVGMHIVSERGRLEGVQDNVIAKRRQG